jgi:cytochrome c-type biogenesis protein CcmH/NrfF
MLAPESTPDGASDAAAERILQELSNDLMSPYCPGRTIASCPSKNARMLEDHILAEAKAGKTREEIEQQLVTRFGTDIVGYKASPLVVYGTVLVGALALCLLLVAGRRWVRKATVAKAGAPAGAATAAAAGAAGATAPGGEPTRAELDALDDALDEEDGF